MLLQSTKKYIERPRIMENQVLRHDKANWLDRGGCL